MCYHALALGTLRLSAVENCLVTCQAHDSKMLQHAPVAASAKRSTGRVELVARSFTCAAWCRQFGGCRFHGQRCMA
jgi:hypothetical protein